MTEIRTVMGIAISWGKMAFVYLEDGELLDWGISLDASRSEEAARSQAHKWLRYYVPHMAIVEEFDEASRKGDATKALVSAIQAATDEAGVPRAALSRSSFHANKYVEAAALAEEFPQIAPWLPKPRRRWEHEPNNIILFEALSLAVGWWRSSGASENRVIEW